VELNSIDLVELNNRNQPNITGHLLSLQLKQSDTWIFTLNISL